FSSRRRHTRFSRDWSSDVCSSDLNASTIGDRLLKTFPYQLDEIAPYYLQGDDIGLRNGVEIGLGQARTGIYPYVHIVQLRKLSLEVSHYLQSLSGTGISHQYAELQVLLGQQTGRRQ